MPQAQRPRGVLPPNNRLQRTALRASAEPERSSSMTGAYVNKIEDAEYQKASSKYSASYMSNAKWLKLFRAVISAGVKLECVRWKFIDTEHSVEASFPEERDLEPTGFADGKFQPIEYRWLESVFIPHVFKSKAGVGYEKMQDTAAVLAALEKAGHFPVEVSQEGITILGYRI
jgi:hypothetical protein